MYPASPRPAPGVPRPKRLSRLARAGALFTLTTLALTGCAKMNMSLELHPDDTFDGTITMAVSTEFAELAEMDPQELVDGMSGTFEDMPDYASVEPYGDGEFVGSTITIDGAPLSILAEEGDDDAADLKVQRDGDEFVVTGELDMSEDMEGLEALGSIPDPEVSVQITFPGEVSEHTGALEGNTVTWTGQVGEVLEISARGSAVESSADLTFVYLGVGAIVLAAGGATFWYLRKRPGSPPAPYAAGGGSYGPPEGQQVAGYGQRDPAGYAPGQAPYAPPPEQQHPMYGMPGTATPPWAPPPAPAGPASQAWAPPPAPPAQGPQPPMTW